MVDVPPPPEGGGEGDSRATEEQALLAQRPDVPSLASARLRYANALFGVRMAFLSGVRGISFLLPWVAFLMLLVWLDHIIGPMSWRWLTPEEVAHLQSLLFSGAVSALGTAIATKAI